MASMRTGAQIIWEALVREGVTTVFGYPGGAILPAYDALLEYPVRHVLVRHEQGATHMADGFARASGQVGVAIATSGPGATNMVTGIATAMLDSSPVLCITGQVGSRLIGSDAFQETDVTGVTLPITKHNYLVSDVEEIAPTIHEALYVARSGRPGPVLIDITKDAQQASTELEWNPQDVKLPGVPARSTGLGRGVPARRAARQRRQAAGHPRRARRDAGRRHGAGAGAGRAGRHPNRDDAPRHRRRARAASAQHGHDGHARRVVGQRRHPGGRPAAGARDALRRPRHRQRAHLRPERAQDSHRHRPPRSSTRTSAWTWRSRETCRRSSTISAPWWSRATAVPGAPPSPG